MTPGHSACSRKGRIQRIGQLAKRISIYNLRYAGSVEDRVHATLSDRLREIHDIFGQMPEDVDVLVTHSTPTVEGSYIAGRPEESMGCDALRDVILEKKPRVCVCGHIHAKEHHPAMLGETVVMNVSRIHGNERYAPAYRPRVFEMKRKEGKFVCEYDATDDMRVARKR